MLFDDKKQALCRIAVGAVAGVAVHVLLGYVLGTLGFFGDRLAAVFSSPTCSFPAPFACWGILLSYLLFALLGAEIGVSTLPFADHGRTLVLRTLAHFTLMAATVALWAGLNFGQTGALFGLILLASVYVLVWLGRWVGWYVEVAAIRSKLGLAPSPSLLHWRETLPYLVFALGLCLGLPALLRLLDPQDVPVLSGVYFPFLLLPIGTFCSGLSLGHRHGFSPLYPVTCALLSVAAVFLLFNGSALFHGGISLVCALMGNGVGTLLKKRPPREKNP